MQGFQIRENYFKQVITIYMGPIKGVKEEGAKRRIKHTFVKHITY